jgi:hypothetical protein
VVLDHHAHPQLLERRAVRPVETVEASATQAVARRPRSRVTRTTAGWVRRCTGVSLHVRELVALGPR